MTTVLVSLGVLALAALAAPRLAPRLRVLVTVAVLAVPVIWTLPNTLRHDSHRIDRYSALTRVQAEVVPPIRWPGYTNVQLLLGIRSHVPHDATVSFLPGGRWATGRDPAQARRIYIQSGWVRWVAFVVAPRIVVAGAGAPWAVLADQSPAEAGLRPRRAWRYGQDWLVQR